MALKGIPSIGPRRRKYVGKPTGATNLVPNGGFETDTTGWAGNSTSSVARSTAWSDTGVASLVITSAASDNYCALGALTFPSAGTYIISMVVKTPAGMASTVQISSLNFTSASMGTPETLAADQVRRISRTITVDAGDLVGSIALYKNGAAESGPIYVDSVQVELGSIATPYIETDGGTVTRQPLKVIG